MLDIAIDHGPPPRCNGSLDHIRHLDGRSQVPSFKSRFPQCAVEYSWSTLRSNLSGNFHGRYDVCAFVAADMYLQMSVTEAVYPDYAVEKILLSGQSYMVIFYGKPRTDGIWSLTMYEAAQYLAPTASIVIH
ncbi:hypothetical protein DFH07DRAFT_831340 [Mycena maculata]|uniref:Uncharacterized protein n=1 Tax=Mycena maculata TaxID=230809 RepID=A0AAD7N5A8_9AGAR|nr:hypothetical protein DFH07DRAFT_831340 [Mycena maculata]